MTSSIIGITAARNASLVSLLGKAPTMSRLTDGRGFFLGFVLVFFNFLFREVSEVSIDVVPSSAEARFTHKMALETSRSPSRLHSVSLRSSDMVVMWGSSCGPFVPRLPTVRSVNRGPGTPAEVRQRDCGMHRSCTYFRSWAETPKSPRIGISKDLI